MDNSVVVITSLNSTPHTHTADIYSGKYISAGSLASNFQGLPNQFPRNFLRGEVNSNDDTGIPILKTYLPMNQERPRTNSGLFK